VFGLLLACFLFAAGLAGTIVPVIPGTLLIWLGMFVYGLLNSFSPPGWSFYFGESVALGLLGAGAFGDRLLRRYGLSGYAVCGGILGALAGALAVGATGIFWGPPMGAVTGELLSGRPPDRALVRAFGTLAGLSANRFFKLLVELVLIGWFLSAVRLI